MRPIDPPHPLENARGNMFLRAWRIIRDDRSEIRRLDAERDRLAAVGRAVQPHPRQPDRRIRVGSVMAVAAGTWGLAAVTWMAVTGMSREWARGNAGLVLALMLGAFVAASTEDT